MSLAELTDPAAVQQALEEFQTLGRDKFLAKYGFGRSRSYFLTHDGHVYDSKAIAGAAHGFQHPSLGPLRATDFSGGDATVRARLEELGFVVVVTEPRTGAIRPLVLFEDYDRREVHDIFAPDTDFTPGAGLWGLQGIIEHRDGEFVLFVTFGREQGDHKFDEGITSDGVLTWQSQPNQTQQSAQVQQLVDHDSERANVRLFLRAKVRGTHGELMPYTFLGRLAYIAHDTDRDRPVHFHWQLIDAWPPADSVLTRMGLTLITPESVVQPPASLPGQLGPGLVETPPPTGEARRGRRTVEFRARRSPDRSGQDAKNRHLGLAGEVASLAHEIQRLRAAGRDDLARQVRHVSVIEGDGAGYDVRSFEVDGADRFIEVKTTSGGLETDFLITANEIAFSDRHAATYCLYRLHTFDPVSSRGKFYVRRGSLSQDSALELAPLVFRARTVAVMASGAVRPKA